MALAPMSSLRCSKVLMLAVAGLVAPLRAAFAGDCAAPVSTQDLVEVLERAEAAYQEMDLDGFRVEADEAARALPCSSEVLPRPLVARYHRLQGLRAFVVRDSDRAPLAFAAARAIEPAYVLPESMVPLDHPLRQMYGAVPVESRLTTPLPQPADGYVLIDGRESLDRPTNLPAVLQRVSGAGELISSVYLWPENPAPEYEVAAATASAPESERAPEHRRGAAVGWGVGAGVSLVAAGVSQALASQKEDQYYDLSRPPDALDRLRTIGRFEQAGALAGLAVGVGCAVGLTLTVWK